MQIQDLTPFAPRVIATLAKEEGKEKSSEARELIRDGVKFKRVVADRRGKVSLGTLAHQMGVSVSDAVDILAELGVAAPIGYDDYLEGYAELNRIFSNLKQKWR